MGILPSRSILISFLCIILSFFNVFSICSFLIFPSFSSVLMPQPIVRDYTILLVEFRVIKDEIWSVEGVDSLLRGSAAKDMISNRCRARGFEMVASSLYAATSISKVLSQTSAKIGSGGEEESRMIKRQSARIYLLPSLRYEGSRHSKMRDRETIVQILLLFSIAFAPRFLWLHSNEG